MKYFKQMLKTIKRRESALAQNESGQVLILFAVIGMLLVFCVGTITDYGQTVTKAINTQNAADAAALAAGSWVARGGNVQQFINGIHYDVNLTLAQIITMSLNICLIIYIILMAIYIILAVNPFTAAAAPPFQTAANTVRNIEDKIIKVCTRIHDVANKIIDPVQKVLVKATPLIAMLHSNYAAHNNGATPLPQLIIDLLPISESIKSDINQVLDYVSDVFPLCTWTLGYNMKMWEMLEVTEVFESPDTYKYLAINASKPAWAHPYRLNMLMPFTAAIPFWSSNADKLNWHDSFIMQKNKKPLMMGFGKFEDAFGFSMDIDIMPNWLSDIIDKIKGFVEDLITSAMAWILDKIGWPWIDFSFPCMGDDKDGAIPIDEPQDPKPEWDKEDIAFFTFIVGFKSEWGTFLKLFGPTIDKDPKEDKNVPTTWALATVKIRGHPIHPGGLYKKSDDTIGQLKLTIVPFWISCEPFFPQARLVSGYIADWEAMLTPVMFKLTSGMPKDNQKSTIPGKGLTQLKGKSTFQKLKTMFGAFKELKSKSKTPPDPKVLPGKYLSLIHI